MTLRRLLVVFVLALSIGQVGAQNIHFTQFNLSPLTLNPAYTGAFLGSVRVGGIYRAQDFSFLQSNLYSTPSVYVDSPIMRGFGKNDWVGVGGFVFQDQAGRAALTYSSFQASVAYHLALDKKRKNVLTLGLQGGTTSRRIKNLQDTEQLKFELDITAPGTDLDRARLSDQGTNHFDLNAGLMLTSNVNKQTNLRLGAGVYHLTNPKYSLLNRQDLMPIRVNVHATVDYLVNKLWSFTPSMLWTMQSGIANQRDLALQGMAGYLLNPEKEVYLNFGLGYRVGDAAEFLFGIDMKNLRVGLAYDLTLSGKTQANSTVGGVELAAMYIINIYKKPDPDPIIFCPRL